MTLTDVTSPPLLSLPSTYVEQAVQAIGAAQLALIRADHVEWESVAADQYLAELRELNSMLARLAHSANTAHEQWVRARSLARAWGQL